MITPRKDKIDNTRHRDQMENDNREVIMYMYFICDTEKLSDFIYFEARTCRSNIEEAALIHSQ